mmetsp:Transcript_30245/g.69328  ORF Transcript_30245/g.69328 Transcript_30245/m.69328 type:complete len:206 (+) Transcript_30245:366-983(+)
MLPLAVPKRQHRRHPRQPQKQELQPLLHPPHRLFLRRSDRRFRPGLRARMRRLLRHRHPLRRLPLAHPLFRGSPPGQRRRPSARPAASPSRIGGRFHGGSPVLAESGGVSRRRDDGGGAAGGGPFLSGEGAGRGRGHFAVDAGELSGTEKGSVQSRGRDAEGRGRGGGGGGAGEGDRGGEEDGTFDLWMVRALAGGWVRPARSIS